MCFLSQPFSLTLRWSAVKAEHMGIGHMERVCFVAKDGEPSPHCTLPPRCPPRGSFVDESDGLQISLRQIEPPSAAPAQPLFTAKLWLTGPDKPGLLFHLVNVCAEQGLNIERRRM